MPPPYYNNGYGPGSANAWSTYMYTPSVTIPASAENVNFVYFLGSGNHPESYRPNEGKPDSTYTAPNGDKRTYGPDGKPQTDYDHDDHNKPEKHPHDESGGHSHDWVDGKRGAPYTIDWKVIGGIGLVVVVIVAGVVLALDDATGVGAFDDFLFASLAGLFTKGLTMAFG